MQVGDCLRQNVAHPLGLGRTFHQLGHKAAAAGVKQQLELDAKRVPGLRLLPGRFMEIRQAIGAPKARGEEAGAYLQAFIEELKATGFVANALKRHGIEGAAVAPAGR